LLFDNSIFELTENGGFDTMAQYTYACKECEKEFEVKISPDDLDKVQCPQCDGKQLKRIYKNFAMMVKYGKYGGSMGPKGGFSAEDSSCSDCKVGG
jgi:putative FmdB family regulatory protein